MFRNRKFSILRISCSHFGRFYFCLRTEACAEQPEPRDLISPESSWCCPADQKAWRLWLLDWHQCHINIWSKKIKERAEKKKGKRGSSQLVETKENKSCDALFSLWAGHIWYSPTGNSWLWNATLILFTSKTDKACEWTYNCLIGQYLHISTNGLFGTIIRVAASCF